MCQDSLSIRYNKIVSTNTANTVTLLTFCLLITCAEPDVYRNWWTFNLFSHVCVFYYFTVCLSISLSLSLFLSLTLFSTLTHFLFGTIYNLRENICVQMLILSKQFISYISIPTAPFYALEFTETFIRPHLLLFLLLLCYRNSAMCHEMTHKIPFYPYPLWLSCGTPIIFLFISAICSCCAFYHSHFSFIHPPSNQKTGTYFFSISENLQSLKKQQMAKISMTFCRDTQICRQIQQSMKKTKNTLLWKISDETAIILIHKYWKCNTYFGFHTRLNVYSYIS